LKIFTTSVASVAALFFGDLSALLWSLMNFDTLLQDHQEIKKIVKRREEIAKSSLEALDEIDIMLTESIQTCKDMNKYAEAAVKHKAMWSAFWRNLAIEVVVLTGATWAYLAHVLHHTQ
jgi:trehalose/maltose hydrolase-like predicted phosphorylase